jgi:hypothetical protein
MPSFRWDEVAVLKFFGTLPEESEEFGRNVTFRVHDGEVLFEFSVNLDTADCSVMLGLRGREAPLFQAIYLGSPGARVVEDRRGYFLEIGAPGAFAGPYDAQQPLGQGLRVWLEPRLQVSVFVS